MAQITLNSSGVASNGSLLLQSNGTTTAVTIDTSQNVGIGTSSPNLNGFNKELTVSAGTSGTARAGINIQGSRTTDSTFGALSYYHQANIVGSVEMIRGGADNSGIMQFFTANAGTTAERMRIASSGNVGIGTSSPLGLLNVKGSNGQLVLNNGGSSGGMRLSAFTNAGTANGFLAFEGYSSEYGRFDSSGNLLVGTAGSFGFRFQSAAASGQSAAWFYRDTATTADNVVTVSSNVGGTGSNRLVILASGNVQNVNNSYGAISDIKLKENVVDATPKLEKLNQVRIVNYNLIGDEQKQLGIIAQELEQIFPGMVEETPDRDKDGNDLGTTTKSVKYSVFVPMLIKAIQEQQAIITSLTDRITALEAK